MAQPGSLQHLLDMKEKAARFVWTDCHADLEKLNEIARKYSPDGTFRLVEDYYIPDNDHEEGWVQAPRALMDWLQFLEDKYESQDVVTMITIKAFDPLFDSGADEH